MIVIDPLVSAEVAAAGLGLYRTHRGDRPVTGVIYTHSHIDHFGGVAGVVDGEVPILAPEGFWRMPSRRTSTWAPPCCGGRSTIPGCRCNRGRED